MWAFAGTQYQKQYTRLLKLSAFTLRPVPLAPGWERGLGVQNLYRL